MRRSASGIVCCCLAVLLLGLGLSGGPARAAQCSDVYPGALIGPPPEWTFWADGSACFVRWVPETPQHEDQLLEQCRNTPQSRFVHFERAGETGPSICIFKLLEPAPQVAGDDRSQEEKEVARQAALPRPDDTAGEEAFGDLKTLVVKWNEECLERERAQEPPAARMCWMAGVEELGQFTADHEISNRGLASQLEQLRSAWIKRAEQLGDHPAPAILPKVEPAAVQRDGADPNRLAATARCSSISLGDYKRCIRVSKSEGEHEFTLSLEAGCESGSIAAISTTDEKGRCIRRVTALAPNAGSATIESYGEPGVLDAIPFRTGVYECYARRHENISCDGKTDYSAPQTTVEQLAPPERPKKQILRKKRPQKQASRKKQRRTAAAAEPQPARKATSEKSARAANGAEQITIRRNYSHAAQPPDKPKKQAGAGNQTPTSLKCLLFRKCP